MQMKRCLAAALGALIALDLAASAFPVAARAEGEGDAPAVPAPAAAADLSVASAANAAALLRAGEDDPACDYWLTAYGHVVKKYPLKRAAVAMLQNTVGLGNAPCGRTGVRFQPCDEVPLPTADEELQKDLDYNIHGALYTDSPLVSATLACIGKDGKHKETQTVTFDPAANVRSYSLDSKEETVEGKALDKLFDVSTLPAGRYTISLTVKTQAAEATPFSVDVKIVDTSRYLLTRNKFDDNFLEANRFFGGDAEQFLFHYSLSKSRNISTENDWRNTYLQGESKLGRVHEAAVPYFDMAADYLESTYVCVTWERTRSDGTVSVTNGRVTQLKKLMHEYRAYVPRFQSNMEFLSHHTLGTAIDVNDTWFPNSNVITNHELVYDEVKNKLVFNGVKTDDKGQQYYDFTYTGSYKAKFERMPTTIVNYLLYEFAFFRAGFQWGYYYETACDGMHFMLTENDINRHMDTDIGLHNPEIEYID